MTKVTITASEIAEGNVVNVSTAPVDDVDTETLNTLTAENPTLEVDLETTVINSIEEAEAEEDGEGEEGDDE